MHEGWLKKAKDLENRIKEAEIDFVQIYEQLREWYRISGSGYEAGEEYNAWYSENQMSLEQYLKSCDGLQDLIKQHARLVGR